MSQDEIETANTTADDRPAVYQEGDTWIFRGSAFGKCPIKLAAIATGRQESFGPHITRAFRQGVELEKITLWRMEEAGLELDRTLAQEPIELELLGGLAIIRGHMDGFTPRMRRLPWTIHADGSQHIPPVPAIVEVKSASGESYDRFIRGGRDAFPEYRAQTDYYCHWARANGWPDAGILIVFQAKDQLDDMCARFYPDPHSSMDDLEEKAIDVLGKISQFESGSAPTCKNHNQQQFSCPFADLHDEEPVDVLHSIPLEIAAYDYVMAGRQIKEFEEVRKSAMARIAEVVTKKTKIGEYSVSVVQTSRTDYSRFFRDHPDLAKKLIDYQTASSHLRIYPPADMVRPIDTDQQRSELEDMLNFEGARRHV